MQSPPEFGPDTGRRPLAAILAGGRSRRFGSPKALAELQGRPLLAWVRDSLRQTPADAVVIANDPAPLAAFGLPCRADTVRDAGPLSGIHAALLWAAELDRPGALCVGVDMPFLDPRLLRRLLERADASRAPAVVPESTGPLGFEPLCAFYRTTALPVIERCLATGPHALEEVIALLGAERLPLAESLGWGDPETLFFNVNTPEQHARATRLAHGSRNVPPVVSIVGKKNSGKTTLVVAVAAELKRRGFRVASVKHGHHAFEIDQPGRDSWRHFHEGEVEAVLLASAGKLALVMRTPGEDPDSEALIRRFFAGTGYDLVLVEGFKYGPFPKIEVFRRAVHQHPVYDSGDPEAAARFVAVVTDDPHFEADVAVLALDPSNPQGSHVAQVVALIEQRVIRRGTDGR